jgi:hypothetical protein
MLRQTGLAFLTAVALGSSAAAFAAAAEPPATAPQPAIDRGILALFAEMETVWRSREFGRMRGFWAKDLEAPLYLPEEKHEFITTWAAFDAYFANAARSSRGGKVRYKPLLAVPVGERQRMVAFELEWLTHLRNEDAPIGGSVRGVSLVEYDGSEWKLRAYVEAPLAPIVYMRELYKLFAKDRGFEALP